MMQARPIPQKVVRLVPMLGSTVDHEALSAARAIGRVLDREGLGFTDLAAAIPVGDFCGAAKVVSAPTQAGGVPRQRDNSVGANRIRPFDTYAWKRAFTPRQEEQHRARVRFCQDRAWQLTDWERGFLNNVARLHGNLSIKQADRLAAMTDRLDMEVRRA